MSKIVDSLPEKDKKRKKAILKKQAEINAKKKFTAKKKKK